MAFEAITIEIRESAGLITLDRPEKLNALSNTLANELDSAVTGFEQDDEDAFRIGLLNKLVPAAELMKASLDMVKLIAGNDARVVPGIKDILNRSVGMGFREMYENEMHTVAASLKAPHPSESFAGFLKRTGKH